MASPLAGWWHRLARSCFAVLGGFLVGGGVAYCAWTAVRSVVGQQLQLLTALEVLWVLLTVGLGVALLSFRDAAPLLVLPAFRRSLLRVVAARLLGGCLLGVGFYFAVWLAVRSVYYRAVIPVGVTDVAWLLLTWGVGSLLLTVVGGDRYRLQHECTQKRRL